MHIYKYSSASKKPSAHTNEKAHNFRCRLFLHLVRLAGIEPTTPWFVAKYSIQLSYSRLDLNYSMVLLNL